MRAWSDSSKEGLSKPTEKVSMAAGDTSAAMAAYAGITSSIRVSTANPNAGFQYELEVIAMTVIGGTVLTGGKGTIIGTIIGIGAAVGLTRLMRGFLVGVAPNDPLVFVTVPALLLVACATASLLPALRASRVNPVEALREG